MLQHHQRFAVAVIMLAVYMMAMVGEGIAEDLSIKLVVNPSKTDVYLDSDPIALTARVKGKNLEYEWKLLGPGELEGKGSSVFYILPEKIEGDSEQALITVTVKDESGEEVTESVTFNILPKEKSTGKGMSKGTKIGIGVGAAAALGGGIALMAGGGDDDDDDDGDAEYNIVGAWWFERGTGDTYGYGNIQFDGSAFNGTYTRIDENINETVRGTYLIEGTNVSMDEPDEIWTGIFTGLNAIQGTWQRKDNPDMKGSWGLTREN